MATAPRVNLGDRYEIKETLGRGGMGIVYRAMDRSMQREVAIKTLLDIESQSSLDQFYRESAILANMVHPNLIGIYDVGSFEEDGVVRPFFVMPLLPGVTLDKLIRDGSPRLTVDTVVDMMAQAARGLHAAHEQGLIHRDVKPSNIFVLDDNSVKIIDFGIARLADQRSKTTLKGTLYYISPEQLSMQSPTPMVDQFALAVVTYETLTRRRPFDGASDNEIARAIQRHTPPPVSQINNGVNYEVSQVIHKAMAKQPWHRFPTIREFGDSILKGRRKEPIPFFDTARIKPRIERAIASFEQGDFNFASDIVSELEGEGHVDPDIVLLRQKLDQAMRRSRNQSALDNARRFYDAQEYQLALRKVQEALDSDPTDEEAISLKNKIERERREKKIGEWIELAGQHIKNHSFRQAREAIDNVLRVRPNDPGALRLQAEIARREQDFEKVRDEKARLYQGALEAYERGDISGSLSKMDALLHVDKENPEQDSVRSSTYQSLYNKVHSEHDAIRNALQQARRDLAEEKFSSALAACEQFLSRYPSHALFQALKFDIEERQRQRVSAAIAEVDRRAESEPDMDRRVALLEETVRQFPGEGHFERALRVAREKRDLIASLIAKARDYEEFGQFAEALDQWQIIKSIHERYPGLQFEIDRLSRRRQQQDREQAKSKWVEQIDRAVEHGDYAAARAALARAAGEFPGDPELDQLQLLIRKHEERGSQAHEHLQLGRDLIEKGRPVEGLQALRKALDLDPVNQVVRAVMSATLLDQGRKLMDSDPSSAETFVDELIEIDPMNMMAQSLRRHIADRQREEFVSWVVAQARRMQAEGDMVGAVALVSMGLATFPDEARLSRLKETFGRTPKEAPEARVAFKKPVIDVPPELPIPSTVRPPKAPAPPEAAPPGPAPLAWMAPSVPAATFPPAVTPPPTPQPATPAFPQPRARQQNRGTPAWQVLLALLLSFGIVGAVIYGIVLWNRQKMNESATGLYQADIRSSESDAVVFLDGRQCGLGICKAALAPGPHRTEARMDGYQTTSAMFTVTPNNRGPQGPITLTLRKLK